MLPAPLSLSAVAAPNTTLLQLEVHSIGRGDGPSPIAEIGVGRRSGSTIVCELQGIRTTLGSRTERAGEADIDGVCGRSRFGRDDPVEDGDSACIGAAVAADVDVGQRRVQPLPDTAKLNAKHRTDIVRRRETGDARQCPLETSDNSGCLVADVGGRDAVHRHAQSKGRISSNAIWARCVVQRPITFGVLKIVAGVQSVVGKSRRLHERQGVENRAGVGCRKRVYIRSEREARVQREQRSRRDRRGSRQPQGFGMR